MTQRRGASEILAVMFILAALGTAMGLMLQYSNEKMFENTVTATEAIAIATERSSELVTVVSYDDTPAVIEVLNYGTTPIGVDRVYVDTADTAYTLTSGGKSVTSIEPNRIVEIATVVSGTYMLVVTDSGNLINVDLGE